jgi:hypothetical protein
MPGELQRRPVDDYATCAMLKRLANFYELIEDNDVITETITFVHLGIYFPNYHCHSRHPREPLPRRPSYVPNPRVPANHGRRRALRRPAPRALAPLPANFRPASGLLPACSRPHPRARTTPRGLAPRAVDVAA